MKLEIVTPEKLVFSENIEMATLPGAEGEFGVLQSHSPLISELKEGEIKIYNSQSGGAPSQSFAIDGGVAQVAADTCTVLVSAIKAAA
jgi:F-type H+-transporting ATPase subunit epsilon